MANEAVLQYGSPEQVPMATPITMYIPPNCTLPDGRTISEGNGSLKQLASGQWSFYSFVSKRTFEVPANLALQWRESVLNEIFKGKQQTREQLAPLLDRHGNQGRSLSETAPEARSSSVQRINIPCSPERDPRGYTSQQIVYLGPNFKDKVQRTKEQEPFDGYERLYRPADMEESAFLEQILRLNAERLTDITQRPENAQRVKDPPRALQSRNIALFEKSGYRVVALYEDKVLTNAKLALVKKVEQRTERVPRQGFGWSVNIPGLNWLTCRTETYEVENEFRQYFLYFYDWSDSDKQSV